MNNKIQLILNEINNVLSIIDDDSVNLFINEILSANKIVVVGAGRVGYALRGFSMRLSHMGLSAYMLGDTNVPNIGKGDLLIVASGSGETQTIYDIVKIAKDNKSNIISICGNLTSRIALLSDVIIYLKTPNKNTHSINPSESIQPMTTLNEQCIGILCDSIVLKIMEKLNETHITMWNRHSNLE